MKSIVKFYVVSVLHGALVFAGAQVEEQRTADEKGFTLGVSPSTTSVGASNKSNSVSVWRSFGPVEPRSLSPVSLYLEQAQLLRNEFDKAFTSTDKLVREKALNTYRDSAKTLRQKFDAALDKAFSQEFAESFKNRVHLAQDDFDKAFVAWTSEWLEKGGLSPKKTETAYPVMPLNLDLQQKKQNAREAYKQSLESAYDEFLNQFKKAFIG